MSFISSGLMRLNTAFAPQIGQCREVLSRSLGEHTVPALNEAAQGAITGSGVGDNGSPSSDTWTPRKKP